MEPGFYEAIKTRRSVYALGRENPPQRDNIVHLVEQCMLHAPSFFNCQPTRAVLLFDADHQRLWDIVWETLQKTTPPERLTKTKEKIDKSFAAGFATILFFLDDKATEEMAGKFPLYAPSFPSWAEQSAGILQYLVWTTLAAEGLGASLQHYNPLIDDEVKSRWSIPEGWRLMSQMPLGSIAEPPAPKEFIDPKTRMRVYP